ncbi:MAG: hypothetical protein MUO39_03740 [Steroidobacteraceae bacterium]|nr:hypothetical protein [Steroidobacteraceae bacterium]
MHAAFDGKAGGLLLAEQCGERLDFRFERCGAALGCVQSALQLALADREHVGSDLDLLTFLRERGPAGALLGGGAFACLFERLQPQAFGREQHRFRESVQGGGSGVEASGEATPPGVEQRVYRVRGAAANLRSDLLDGGALALAQQGVRGTVDVTGSYAALGGGGGDAAGKRWRGPGSAW